MIKEFKEKFINNEFVHYVEKYIIVSDYYSKENDLLESSIDAYTQNIKIAYDIMMVSNSDKSETSMLSTPIDITKHSKIETTNNADDISTIVEKLINSKHTQVNISVDSQSTKIILYDKMILKLFNYFNIVNINLGNFEEPTIILPDGDFKLFGFKISGGTILFPNNFNISVTSNLEISSANIKCEITNNPSIQVVGKTVYLDQLSFTQPVKIITGVPYQDNSDEFAKTEIYLNRLNFNLNGFDESKDVSNDPLITVGSNNYTEVTDVSLNGGSFAKFIKFSGVKSVVVNNFKRVSKSINAYSIGLDSVRSLRVVEARVLGEIIQTKNANLLSFDTTKTTILDTIELNSVTLINCGLASLDSLNIKLFTVMNCLFEGNTFLTTLNNNIGKIVISNSRLDIDKGSVFEGGTIEFIDSVIISEKEDLMLHGKDSLVISNNKITCGNNNLTIKLENSCNTVIKNSDILSKNFVVRKVEDDPSLFSQIVELASVKRIKFLNTNLKLGGEFNISGVDNQIYDGIKFTNASAINISDASLMTVQLFALDVDKIIPIKFKSDKFKNGYFISNSSPTRIPIDFDDCDGDLYFIVKDMNTENRSSCDINILSVNSKIGVNIGSDNFSVRAKVKSSNSLGSCFFGGNNVIVVPEIQSDDSNAFERVSAFTKKYKCVCYGNV